MDKSYLDHDGGRTTLPRRKIALPQRSKHWQTRRLSTGTEAVKLLTCEEGFA